MPGAKASDPLHMPIPERASERQKMLENLYAYLATAVSEAEAAPIAVTIERLWLLNGTDTTAYLMERAVRALSEKELDKALSFMDQVVELAPDYAEGWNRRAYIHFVRGDLERALGDLRRCLALEPSHFRALEAIAAIFKEGGQKAAALKAYEKLNELHPNLPGLQETIKDLSRSVDGQKT